MMLLNGNALALTHAPLAASGRTLPITMQTRKAGWLPGAFAPSYLDGSLPGDVGFDPLSLVALAPTGTKAQSRCSMSSPSERRLSITISTS